MTSDPAANADSLKLIKRALEAGDLPAADAEGKRLSPARAADVTERLPSAQRAVLFRLLPENQAAEVFEDLAPVLQRELVDSLRDEEVTAVFAELEPDDRVALLDEVPAGVAAKLMKGLSVSSIGRRHKSGS